MQIIPQAIPEVLLLVPQVFGDQRGFFVETARQNLLQQAGIPELIQHNQSRSRQGVLRGLHYQLVQLNCSWTGPSLVQISGATAIACNLSVPFS